MQILSDAPLLRGADVQNGFLEPFSFRNIESHTVDEPWPSIFPANHLRLALKPKHSSIARNHAVSRSQRLAGQEHFRGLHAPSHLVIGMNLPVPAHRVFQPFALR